MQKQGNRVAAVLLLAASSLAIYAQQVGPLAPGERIRNLDKLKDDLRAYHDCSRSTVCYQRDLDLQAGRAIAFLQHRAAHARPGDKLALVLDIDETTLSNYEELTGADFASDSAKLNAWIEEGKAPAIAGTLRLYKEAQRLGVHVFFLTGRPESQRDITEKNLRAAGYDNWQQLILRQKGEENATAQAYKSKARAGIVADGYRIILNVGDQWSDLQGKPMAEYSVKYPDPYYFLK